MVYCPGFSGLNRFFASFDQPVSIFISDDFPTFDLPINPNSGFDGAGHSFSVGLLLIKVAE